MKALHQKIFKAIRKGRIDEVKTLLTQGVYIEARLKNGQTLLIYAIAHKQKHIAEFLLGQGANIEARENRECTPLILAVEKNLLEMVQLLLKYGACVDARKYCYDGFDECDPRHWSDSALIIAARQNNYPMVKLLLDHGADPSLYEECEGLTALHTTSSPKIIQILIDYGANVNADAKPDEQVYTPLMWAAACHQYAKAKMLIDNGADIYRYASIDGTAAHIAAESECVSIVKLLLEAGFDPHFIAPQSMSLLWHGRYILSEKDGEKFLKLLMKYCYDINMKYRGAMDFMRLAHYESLGVVTLLVKYGADIHALDDNGKSVLGHIYDYSKAKNLKYLFSLGIKMTEADEKSLFFCIEHNLLDILQVFLENGANINAINAEGCSLVDYAKNSGNQDSYNFLRNIISS